MKKTLFVLVLLSATAAFAQYTSGTINNQVQPYQFTSHPAHAAYAAMSQETSVLAGTSYGSASGERPVSDFPQAAPVPLGTVARELRKQHDQLLKKSRIVWVNQ
jgi:hypothetical protein